MARHIPFWGIPLIILGGEFGYNFWLKKKKQAAYFCVTMAALGFFSIVFYYWAGGPEKSVKLLKKMHRENFQ